MSEADWLAWDKQIERDLLDGRLDKLIEEATEAHRRGLTLSFEEGKRAYQEMSDKK
ncbi:hypothetical protein BH09BAC4_BH09BAC4_10330 [soil metagenome]